MNWPNYQIACQLLRDAITANAHRIAVEHAKLQPNSNIILQAQREKNQCCDRLYALTPFLDTEIAAILGEYGTTETARPRTAATECSADRRQGKDRRSGVSDRRAAPRWPNTGWPMTEQA